MKRTAPLCPASQRTVKRIHALIEMMLKEMQLGLRNPSYCATEDWEKLFGSKQSMVANLQKLVGALVALPEFAANANQAEKEVMPPLTAEDINVLLAWMKKGEAGET